MIMAHHLTVDGKAISYVFLEQKTSLNYKVM